METIFSMNGRIGRGSYAFRMLIITLGTVAASLAAGAVVGAMSVGNHSDMAELSSSLGMLIGAAGTVLAAFQAVKRLHDLGRSGAHYFLLWIPIYNVYAGLELLCRRGAEGPNKYGDDPVAVIRLGLGVAA